MLLLKNKRGQSMLEYALLLGVVIAGILIMQIFVKRSVQGGWKDSADKIGDQFSAGGTAISQSRNMTDQSIIEETATTTRTDVGIGKFVTDPIEGAFDGGAYSLNKRTGGDATTEVKQQTDSATQEKVRWNEYQNTTYNDFTEPF